MRDVEEEEEDSSCRFSQLPSPDELTPLSQTLITPHLALAFDIPTSTYPPPPPPSSSHHHPDFDSSSGAAPSDEPARTLKRPRLVWTPQLHKRFVDAVAHLGIKNAVPKTIMQLMSVDGLTRENVASHLQKYRLYLKRMQTVNNSGGGTAAGSGDPATDHLFASSPVPPHFLHPQGYVHHQHMPAGGQFHHHHHRQVGKYEHPFLSRQAQIGGRVIVGGVGPNSSPDLESATAANGRKVLTLFPTAEN